MESKTPEAHSQQEEPQPEPGGPSGVSRFSPPITMAGLKALHKLTSKIFGDFIRDFNSNRVDRTTGSSTSTSAASSSGSLYDLTREQHEALKSLHGMWKNSKAHFKAKDVKYFFDMKQYHVKLNLRLLGEVQAWDRYIFTAMQLRTTFQRMLEEESDQQIELCEDANGNGPGSATIEVIVDEKEKKD